MSIEVPALIALQKSLREVLSEAERENCLDLLVRFAGQRLEPRRIADCMQLSLADGGAVLAVKDRRRFVKQGYFLPRKEVFEAFFGDAALAGEEWQRLTAQGWVAENVGWSRRWLSNKRRGE